MSPNVVLVCELVWDGWKKLVCLRTRARSVSARKVYFVEYLVFRLL